MTPIKRDARQPAIMQDGRIVADGPAAANIPGVVAGLDYLYRNYGSGKVKWEDLVAPAITLADEGFVLDEGAAVEHRRRPPLPREVAGGREDLPAGRQGAAARAIGSSTRTTRPRCARSQKGGADAFYRARSRKKIAADMEENGGIIDVRRSGAVSRDRARAGRRALSRPHAVCRRPAGVDRHPAVRVAARARELSAASRARAHRRTPTISTT